LFLACGYLGTPTCQDLELENNANGLELIVCVGGMFGVPYEVIVENLENGHFSVRPLANGDENVRTSSVIVDVVVNGKEETLQIQPEDSTGVFEVTYQGANFEALVMTPEEFKMSQHMLEPKEIDTSNLILSPMPGTLMSYSVELGESVLEGQDICIVEAMKMQNVIRSPCAGVIKKFHANVGSSLMADEIIVEFEKNDAD